MRYAITDIGSNTIRMVVYDYNEGIYRNIMSKSETLGLFGYIENGILRDTGTVRLINVLLNFQICSNAINVDEFHCFATESLRAVKNSVEVLQIVNNTTRIDINIISGDDEALLDFEGFKNTLPLRSGLLIDMGGGSVELIKFDDKNPLNLTSIPFGSLSLYQDFVSDILPDKKETDNIRSFVRGQVSNVDWLSVDSGKMCIIGGTGRAIASLHQEFFKRKEDLHGYTFAANDINSILTIFENKPIEVSKMILKLNPNRIHTIIPGMIAFSEICESSGIETLTISNFGLREGYLKTRVLKLT